MIGQGLQSADHTSRLFYRLFYTPDAFAMVSRAAEALGRDGCRAIARTLAWLYTRTHPGVVETVRQNLCYVVPGRADAALAARVFENFAMGLADYFALGALPLREAVLHCPQREGLEHLQKVHREGRGAILATGHFGFFEFGAALLAELDLPFTALTLGEPSEELTAWRAAYRLRWRAETIEVGADSFSALRVIEALQAGRFCAMLVDRPFGGPCVEVPLPGGTIPFSTSPGLLAHLAGCPVLPVTITQDESGTYRLVAHAPIYPDPAASRAENTLAISREVARVLGVEFASHPEQWYHFAPIGGLPNPQSQPTP
jgi:KDO2-lipid IV(A) lauroyltransferase